jgi:hypothetical protein
MLKVIVHIPSIDFTYVLGEVVNEADGWAMVAEHYGEATDSVNVTFE